jgi:hypothetical protein
VELPVEGDDEGDGRDRDEQEERAANRLGGGLEEPPRAPLVLREDEGDVVLPDGDVPREAFEMSLAREKMETMARKTNDGRRVSTYDAPPPAASGRRATTSGIGGATAAPEGGKSREPAAGGAPSADASELLGAADSSVVMGGRSVFLARISARGNLRIIPGLVTGLPLPLEPLAERGAS